MKQSIENGLQKAGLPIISIKCNDYDLYFLIDTGATENHLLDYAYRAISAKTGDPIKDSPKIVITTGMDGIKHELKVCYLKFNIDENVFNEEFVVTPNSVTFKRISDSLGEPLCGIIGTTFLRKHRIIVDYDERCIWTNNKEQEEIQTEKPIIVEYDIDEVGPIISEYDIDIPDF